MSVWEITLWVIFHSYAIVILVVVGMAIWPEHWTPSGRKEIRDHAEANAAQERKEAAERIRERRTWRVWAERVAWDDAYQSISEQAGIECERGCAERATRWGIADSYSPICPLHKHRKVSERSPVHRNYRRFHLADVQEVLDRLDIIPPTYTEEGTLR